MKFERLRKSHKKEIIIGAIAICIIGGALTFATTRAKYKLTESIDLVKGTINYKVPDFRIVALYTENSSGTYIEASDIPTSGYTLNTEKSMCKVYDGSTSVKNAPKDNNVTIEYTNGEINVSHLTKKNTRCYLYFDTIKDTTKPTINSVTTTVTKTEINVTVTASDIGAGGVAGTIAEYWYQIDSQVAVKGTGNSHTFTGLTPGSTHTIKVYVKDGAGNQSDTTTNSVTTTPDGIIMDNIIAGLNAKTTTPRFGTIAEGDEGVYAVSDGMYGGTSYYWRGAVKNNYVRFAGFCWRIVRINGDKTMRLIYGGSSCYSNGTETTDSIAVTSQAYNPDYGRSEFVGWTYTQGSRRTLDGTPSNAKTQTDTWFNKNITGTNLSKVADGKFCNDRNTASGSSWSSQSSKPFYYAARARQGAPTLSCSSGDIYILKAGAITSDEVEFAGGNWLKNNKVYYLYNGQSYWTMSPHSWSGSGNSAYVFYVSSNGDLPDNGQVNWTDSGIRPVINLRSDVTFKSGGTGTQSNPYVVL